ncbi:sulfatase-like hydrolase/transferase [Maridesulfovibrio salexigens]|uniref:Sulfatase n=1 Tax=Maridesulfovibrio salexigens (strain ATCC 14822 / DSM 2638 / NCIMB 8403 / VKM B-1763) TaxID=526222 RepID=C6C0G4_MARSD|nr:sulfatase-like hydrolase/transferase [Maridesulfovibrio salexigens]ACS79098.1 sulfatase [Maridesulfovibrio salexigens DSM 2638]
MKNIIWIVIDTLRSDMLASCLSETAVYNEIDEVIEQGILFTDVMTSGGSTRISAPSYFSSLRPGLTGMIHHGVQTIRNFKDDVLTVTEHFKYYGYQTFRWDDSSLDSCQPKRGFDVFESGYPTLEHTPHRNYDNDRRDAFIARVRQSKKPFFVNFHLDYIHDFGGNQKTSWTTNEYLKVVARQAKDFKALWDKLAPGPDDIVVVTSDHGCVLDENYIEYDKSMPWGFANNKTRVFASFIAEGLTPTKKHELIRSIDIAPTLLDLALGKEMNAQGVSLKSALQGGPVPELIGISERNVSFDVTGITDYACVRKQNWAFYFHKGAPMALYDNSEGTNVTDHMGEGLPVEEELLTFYKELVLEGPQTATELYEQTGISLSDIRTEIEASILLPVFSWSEETRLCIDALLDQILNTELILLDADSSGEVEKEVKTKYSNRLYIRHVEAKDLPLPMMLNKGLELAKAPFTVTATPDCQYTENFCYSLREMFLAKTDTVLSYPNIKRLISDNREMEYIGNDDCFDELMFSRLGSIFEHKTATAAYSLPHFNEVGACAMFETETMRNAGCFSTSTTDFLAKTWHKLNRLGRVRHVNKGLVISKDRTILRPVMPCPENEHDTKISILVPLNGIADHKLLPMFLTMLSKQTEKSVEIILLNQTADTAIITALAKNFPELKIRKINRTGEFHDLLNSGLYAAKGEYLFWSDVSDKLLPTCLTVLVNQIDGKSNVTAVKCGHFLQNTSNSANDVQPVGQVREMLCEVCDLRGLLYKRRLHNDVGIFRTPNDNEQGWDMSVRLALVKPFELIEEPLIIASRTFQFNMQPSIESYHRILRSSISSMGNTIDLVRLYEDDFYRHRADQARYILEDEMMLTLELINKSGISSGALLRVPKAHVTK